MTSNQGADQLRQWLASEGRKAIWLADRLGVDQTLVSHWLAGRRVPPYEMAEAIEILSDKVVGRAAWSCATISSEP